MTADIDKPVILEERNVIGKGLGAMRTSGMIPAVVHNHGQPSLHVMAKEMDMIKVYRAAGKHHPLELTVGDQNFLALIKDVHFNPVKRRMQHLVFQAIRRDEKVEAEVPVRLDGEIPAEKAGLMVLNQLDHLEVEALPKNLPDELVIDVTGLTELHDKVTVADVEVPEGVTILTDPEHPIVTVIEPRAHAAEEAEAAESEEVPEGEEAEAEGDGGEVSAEAEEQQPS